MNYFDESSEWHPLNLDVELYKEIERYHPYLTSDSPCPEGIDGFFFIDANDFAVLVDMKQKRVRVRKKNSSDHFSYNKKYNTFSQDGFTVYYQNEVIIKDHKKFYSIVSQKRNSIMDFLFKKTFIRNRIYSPN